MAWFALLMLALAPAGSPPDARAAFEAAARALAAGDLAAAEAGFQRVLAAEPGNIGALGNLGVVYMRTERPAEAVAVYRRALRRFPNDAQLNLNLGLAYLKQEDYRAAQPCFERVLAARADHAQARELLASTQLYTGDVAKAVADLELLRQSGSSSALYFLVVGYLKQKRTGEARQALNELFATVTSAQANFLAGRAYYESTVFDDALAAFLKARELEPTLPGLDRELGKTYVSLRRTEEARASLEAALRRNGKDAEAQYFLGALLIRERQWADGVPLLERSLAARPDFWGANYYLGKAQLDQGNAAAAIPFLEKAVAQNPNEASSYYLLSRALQIMGRQADARIMREKYTALSPGLRSPKEAVLTNRK